MSPVRHDLGYLLPVVLGAVAGLGEDDGDGEIAFLGRAPALFRGHLLIFLFGMDAVVYDGEKDLVSCCLSSTRSACGRQVGYEVRRADKGMKIVER